MFASAKAKYSSSGVEDREVSPREGRGELAGAANEIHRCTGSALASCVHGFTTTNHDHPNHHSGWEKPAVA